MALEFLIYGDIGAEIRADALLRAIRRAEADGEPLLIRINSLGGDVFEAVAMADAIAGAKTEIDVFIDSVAASAASAVAAAAPRVFIAPDAFVMIHLPWALTVGDAAAHTRTSGLLNRLAERMARNYAGRMRTSPDRVMALMKTETWFDASQAIAAGLADAIKAGPDAPARSDASPSPTATINRLRAELAVCELRSTL